MADIADQSIDLSINLGDLLSGAVSPAETADILMDWNIPTIRGNHERQLLEDCYEDMSRSDQAAHGELTDAHRDWLQSLPFSLEITAGVLAVHATPHDDLTYLLETVTEKGVRPASEEEILARLDTVTNFDVILCGHTHLKRSVTLATGLKIVNPGSVGWPAYDDDKPFPHVMEAGAPEASYAILDNSTGSWAVEFRAIEYDYEAAANIAKLRDRPEVAYALMTGTMP
ncbi:metallophosphoesterase family protein [Alpinimonas psychrophila]